MVIMIHIYMPATTPPSLDPYDSRPPLQPGDEDEGQQGNYKMMVFHSSMMVFVCFLTAPGWFSWFFDDSRLVFQDSWSVFIVFHGSRLVFWYFYDNLYDVNLTN